MGIVSPEKTFKPQILWEEMKVHITLPLRRPGGEGQRKAGPFPGSNRGQAARDTQEGSGSGLAHMSLSGTGFPKLP